MQCISISATVIHFLYSFAFQSLHRNLLLRKQDPLKNKKIDRIFIGGWLDPKPLDCCSLIQCGLNQCAVEQNPGDISLSLQYAALFRNKSI